MPYYVPSVPLSGGTMSGALTLPALLFEAAGRLYAIGSTVYFRNVADTAYVGIDAADVTARTGVGTPLIKEITATGPYIQLNTGNITIQNRTTVGNVPLIIKGMAGQTGDLQQWQNDLGTSRARLTAGGRLGILCALASDEAFTGQVAGDAQARLTILATGKLSWGDGAAGADTHLYRYEAGTIRTDGSLRSGSLVAGTNPVIDATSPVNIDGSIRSGNRTSGAPYTYHNVLVFRNSAASATGTLKITLPKGWSSDMLRMTIKGYEYGGSTPGAWELHVGGYTYGAGPAWLSASYDVSGRPPFTSVRLGYDGTNVVLLLGTTATVWAYPHFAITEFTATSTGWGSGWSASIITSETGLTQIMTPTAAPLHGAQVGEITATGPYIQLNTGNITIQNRTTVGNIPLIIRGMTGQTGNLQRWYDPAGALVTFVQADGTINTPTVIATGTVHAAFLAAVTGTGPRLAFDATGAVLTNRTTAGNVVYVVKGMAAQTGDLQQWQDSAGAVLGRVRSDGAHTGPAFIVPVATKTANYTLTAADHTILANAALTATLPSAVTAGAGRRYVVKNIHTSATVTLASTAGTIDGAATLSIASMEAVTVISDGANWWAV